MGQKTEAPAHKIPIKLIIFSIIALLLLGLAFRLVYQLGFVNGMSNAIDLFNKALFNQTIKPIK